MQLAEVIRFRFPDNIIEVKHPISITDSVFATVAWFDVFDQPVSAEEAHKYLFWKKASLAEVKKALKKDKRISESFNFYFLKGRNAIVLGRCKRQYYAGKLWKKVFKNRFIFRWTPFVRLAAVGNTLAMGWPEKESDIDFFIVTEKNRLFTARLFLTFFTQIFRLRRHGKKISERYCLSFYRADESFDLSPLQIKPADPYLAFWAATLMPIWGNVRKELIIANRWVKAYFPNLEMDFPRLKKKLTWCEKLLGGHLGNFLEKRLKHWQLKRIRSKMQSNYTEKTSVVADEHILKFHENDRRREYWQEWQKRLGK